MKSAALHSQYMNIVCLQFSYGSGWLYGNIHVFCLVKTETKRTTLVPGDMVLGAFKHCQWGKK